MGSKSEGSHDPANALRVFPRSRPRMDDIADVEEFARYLAAGGRTHLYARRVNVDKFALYRWRREIRRVVHRYIQWTEDHPAAEATRRWSAKLVAERYLTLDREIRLVLAHSGTPAYRALMESTP